MQGIAYQAKSAPVAFSGLAWGDIKRHGCLLVTNPRAQASIESAGFGQFLHEHIYYTAVQQLEVGTAAQVESREPRKDAIVNSGSQSLLESISTSVLLDAMYDLGTVAPMFQHIRYQFRWMLKVGVQGDDGLAAGMLQTGIQCRFLAELA